LVAAVREVLADVVVRATRASDRADESHLKGILERETADAFGAAPEDVVLRQQALELVDLTWEAIEEGVDGFVKAARQIFAQAANPEVAREEPEPGDQLVDVEQQLALANRIEQHRHRADFHRVRAKPNQVTREALEFREEDANVVNPLRHRQTEQLLDGEHVGKAVRLRGKVVHALDERHHLLPLLLLGGLLYG